MLLTGPSNMEVFCRGVVGDDIPGCFRGDNETPELVAGKTTHLVADTNHIVSDKTHNIQWLVFVIERQRSFANFAPPPPFLKPFVRP